MKLRRRKKHEMEPEIELDEDAVVSTHVYFTLPLIVLMQADKSLRST
jgi:hypothetical protein